MDVTAEKPSATPAAVEKPASARLMSVDALRGFDMFWIIGADSLMQALRRMDDNPATRLVADQLEHVDWEGFRFYDLIFPLFVFLVGVSVVLSLTRTIERSGRSEAVKRVIFRSVLLFAIGILYSGGLTNSWPNIRLMGVLNRIPIAYFFAGLLFCFLKPRALVAVCIGLLAGYWALMTFVPVRDIQLTRGSLVRLAEQANDTAAVEAFRARSNPSAIKDSPAWAAAEKLFHATTNRVTGAFDQGRNVSDHFDFMHLPGRKYDQFYDPEGILSHIPAVATCLLGVFAGLLLSSGNFCNKWKVIYLLSAGVLAIALGWLWGMQFPVIKKIWTSSYVLVAGGYSALLLGTFYLIIEVWNRRTWCQPFVWMGMNSITIYIAANLIDEFSSPARRLVGGDIRKFFDAHVAKGFGDLMISIVGLLLAFWFVRFLYKRKIFLRL